jgi:hypothetical protein
MWDRYNVLWLYNNLLWNNKFGIRYKRSDEDINMEYINNIFDVINKLDMFFCDKI